MSRIPKASATDSEDVVWALQTSDALWKRGDYQDAIAWLRRAAQAAGESEDDERALELANDAAELIEWLEAEQRDRTAGGGGPESASREEDESTIVEISVSKMKTRTDEMDEPTSSGRGALPNVGVLESEGSREETTTAVAPKDVYRAHVTESEAPEEIQSLAPEDLAEDGDDTMAGARPQFPKPPPVPQAPAGPPPVPKQAPRPGGLASVQGPAPGGKGKGDSLRPRIPVPFEPPDTDLQVQNPDDTGLQQVPTDDVVKGALPMDPVPVARAPFPTAPYHSSMPPPELSSEAVPSSVVGLAPPALNLGGDKPARFHEVHVCGLEPGTTYHYQVGGETWSAVRSFTTAPRGGKVTVGLSGDARDHVEIWQLVQRRMRELAPTLQIFTGDLVLVGINGAAWTSWLDAIWKDPTGPGGFGTLGGQPILFVAGNHENRAARYFASAAMPGSGPAAETFGSFDLGAAHFVFLDDQPIATDASSPLAKDTLAFLERDLARADGERAQRPFVVVVMHRGIYSSGPHGTDSDLVQARALVSPIFARHKVDLVVTGHDHLYERTKGVRPGPDAAGPPIPDPQGTTYVVCAGAGADPYSASLIAPPEREKLALFGEGTPQVGVYCMLSIEPKRLALEARGLVASQGSAKGDPVVDAWEVVR